MNDDFLYSLRTSPPVDFSDDLYRRLMWRAQLSNAVRLTWQVGPALAAGLLIGLLVVSPGLRASAQAFLDMFSPRQISTVAIDHDDITGLGDRAKAIQQVLGNQIVQMTPEGAPRQFDSVDAAAAALGAPIARPKTLPGGFAPVAVTLFPAHQFTATVTPTMIKQISNLLGLERSTLPVNLTTINAVISLPSRVDIAYSSASGQFNLLQSDSPQLRISPDIDPALIGETWLRLVGVDGASAHDLAQTIDWKTTLLVPTFANAATARAVKVRGYDGLWFENKNGMIPEAAAPVDLLIWSDGQKIYSLYGASPMQGTDLAAIAETIE